MTSSAKSLDHRRTAIGSKSRRTSFHPGGWGDRLVFGYMFRVATFLLSVFVPGIIVFIIGAFNGWELSPGLITFFGVVCALMVLFGEGLRLAVYESRIRPKAKPDRRQSEEVSNEVLAMLAKPALGYMVSKRIMDIAFSGIALFSMIPILVIISVMILFDSPGPVFFRQERLGLRGRKFWIWKFRTMYLSVPNSGDEQIAKSKNDARITRAGRVLRASSLDEIPQLFNVLRGNMSLVGPRPLAVTAARESYIKSINWIKPGLTGIRQVSPNIGGSAEIEYYAFHRSIFSDLKILGRTMLIVFSWYRLI